MRPPTRVRQSWAARFVLVPYNIGWHLAHHVDSGIPFRNLPRLPPRAARGRLRRRHHRVPELPLPCGARSGTPERTRRRPVRGRPRPPRGSRRFQHMDDDLARCMHEWDGGDRPVRRTPSSATPSSGLQLPQGHALGRSHPADVLDRRARRARSRPHGIGGHEALRICPRRADARRAGRSTTRCTSPTSPTAPTIAATMFDLVVSASSIFAGLWEAGAGAIAAENQALAGSPSSPASPTRPAACFVRGGSAANLSALVTARHAPSVTPPASRAVPHRRDGGGPRLGACRRDRDGRRRRRSCRSTSASG